MSNLQLYSGYHDKNNCLALQRSYFDTLKRRASYGSKEAQGYVDKIERGLCAM